MKSPKPRPPQAKPIAETESEKHRRADREKIISDLDALLIAYIQLEPNSVSQRERDAVLKFKGDIETRAVNINDEAWNRKAFHVR